MFIEQNIFNTCIRTNHAIKTFQCAYKTINLWLKLSLYIKPYEILIFIKYAIVVRPHKCLHKTCLLQNHSTNQLSIFTIIPRISYITTVNVDNGPLVGTRCLTIVDTMCLRQCNQISMNVGTTCLRREMPALVLRNSL